MDVLKPLYRPAHLIVFVSWLFALLGLVGFYARQAHRTGVLGLIGFAAHLPFLSPAIRGVRDGIRAALPLPEKA